MVTNGPGETGCGRYQLTGRQTNVPSRRVCVVWGTVRSFGAGSLFTRSMYRVKCGDGYALVLTAPYRHCPARCRRCTGNTKPVFTARNRSKGNKKDSEKLWDRHALAHARILTPIQTLKNTKRGVGSAFHCHRPIACCQWYTVVKRGL